MRVCLIGTSNAMYRDGYAGAIRSDPRVSYFENHSVGASPSTIVPMFGSSIDFSKFDFVVVDTAINDRHFYINDAITPERIRENIKWLIERASVAGCRTALLIMPTRHLMSRETLSGRIYLDYASKASALFDGFDFIRSYSLATGQGVGSLFSDDFHIKRPIAQILGKALVAKIASAMTTSLVRARLSADFVRLDEGSILAPSIERENSAFTLRFAALSHSQEAEVDGLNPGDEVVGLSYNAAATSANLLISSENEVVKNLSTPFYSSGKSLLLNVVPLIQSCRIGADGRLRLSTTMQGATEHSRFKRASDPAAPDGFVELASVLVRRAI